MKQIIKLTVFCLLMFILVAQAYSQTLSGGIVADSLEELMAEKGVKINLEDWPQKWSAEKEIPLETNMPGAKLILVTEPLGGGDYNRFPFIKKGNTYYELNEHNLQKLFAPIESKEQALDYYLFAKQKLGGAWAQSIIYILDEQDYNKQNVIYNGGSEGKEKLNSRVTTVEEVDGGYLITLIGFNYIARQEFFESRIKVNVNGQIERISRRVLLDLGPGAVF